jgi:hypothetical protein
VSPTTQSTSSFWYVFFSAKEEMPFGPLTPLTPYLRSHFWQVFTDDGPGNFSGPAGKRKRLHSDRCVPVKHLNNLFLSFLFIVHQTVENNVVSVDQSLVKANNSCGSTQLSQYRNRTLQHRLLMTYGDSGVGEFIYKVRVLLLLCSCFISDLTVCAYNS